mmetsp:Transcript_12614/g.17597  ORF Transcript_12614/g.17597 Transcript_12614/m.17597 type:complete len:212 (-) Transcript_12614:73-708(-)
MVEVRVVVWESANEVEPLEGFEKLASVQWAYNRPFECKIIAESLHWPVCCRQVEEVLCSSDKLFCRNREASPGKHSLFVYDFGIITFEYCTRESCKRHCGCTPFVSTYGRSKSRISSGFRNLGPLPGRRRRRGIRRRACRIRCSYGRNHGSAPPTSPHSRASRLVWRLGIIVVNARRLLSPMLYPSRNTTSATHRTTARVRVRSRGSQHHH